MTLVYTTLIHTVANQRVHRYGEENGDVREVRVIMLRLKSVLVGVMFLAPALQGKEGEPAFTTIEAAGKDYIIQGEYEGTLDADGVKWGAQVIARGDGRFSAAGFRGGLPGDGWSRGDEVHRVDGEMKGDVAIFEADGFQLHVDGKQLKVVSTDGDEFGTLQRADRKSPTIGAKPPEGAIVLFDGKHVDEWIDGKLIDKKYLGATNAYSKRKFGDHELHLEFRTPFMPKSSGQARGNSGMYLQSRYEVQILDSFGLDGKDNECGGIYNIDEPMVNMCLPPLAWQTYDVKFIAAKYDSEGKKTKNARVTIKHNGVVIHKDLELKHETPGPKKEGPEKESLYLQDHSNPVVFRNIWVVEN